MTFCALLDTYAVGSKYEPKYNSGLLTNKQ